MDDEKKKMKFHKMSFRHKAKKPRKIGLKKRTQWRVNQKKSKHAMARYRYGWRLIWDFAAAYACRLPNFKGPDEYDPKNQHGGCMPALPGDFQLTGKQAATLMEKCAESKTVTWDQLRAISACLSYLHCILTGDSGTNFEEVQQMWDSLQYI
jgi:hypothetical protein